MDRTLLTSLAATALVAGLVAAGAAYVAVSTLAPPPPSGPAPPPFTAPPPSGNATGGSATAEDAIWAFSVRGQLPEQPGARGTVVVFLGKVQGDANLSAANGSIPVELAAVTWDAHVVQPIGNGTILEAMNVQFARAPPVALARAALSRDQDALELTVPAGLNVTTIVVNAPATAGFLAIAWPTGTPYAWNEQAGQWANVREATLLARPLATG